jgi:homocysteine S-methyltransferase
LARLPQLTGTRFVTDGGMETDLIFHHDVDLPAFAAFPLLGRADGRELLERYYDGYAAVAAAARVGLLLESPTWRANPDWGGQLGYDAADLADVNRTAIAFLAQLRDRYVERVNPILISGMVGPRGDGYAAASHMTAEAAAEYHRPQLAAFADAGADLATADTLTDPGEAIGIVLAARDVGLPVAVSFTVETDGALPGGGGIAEAIAVVDASAPPDYYLINCAHPTHIARGLPDAGGAWSRRIAGIRANASTKSHAELDAADQLDEGDVAGLVAAQRVLAGRLPALTIVGGCCGTDARHVGALWDHTW